MIGKHLMLDCYDCDEKKIYDPTIVFDFLDKLPGLVGMHKLTTPYVVPYSGEHYDGKEKVDPGGVSAFVMISESHISFHSWKHPKGYFAFDLYSCKHFDPEVIVDAIKMAFSPKKIEQRVARRGEHLRKVLSAQEVRLMTQPLPA